MTDKQRYKQESKTTTKYRHSQKEKEKQIDKQTTKQTNKSYPLLSLVSPYADQQTVQRIGHQTPSE